ncbi:unnamed protein product (macronuclear) [Paramecium tetraurelia]|uniref:Transmembrane protein n=1 Tax=Paramecium tetraurelia TaxID=5888 RepID=A0DSK3_PARTE|nr:uncharacterized protein GSPATT00019724001 [Paramecium tetraurelia]CAK86020.1 unnamed protein product [Paramecium tetraurelia]|eukprot:XP_001453417.1 hypothetical protein (macronuclear) [Paramecium tetraurelia strain d4-2]
MIRLISSNHNFVVLVLLSLLISSCNTSNHLRGHIEQHQNKHLSSRRASQNPYVDFIVGFFLIFGAIALLWYNERRLLLYNLTNLDRQSQNIDQMKQRNNALHESQYKQLINSHQWQRFIYIILIGETTTNDLVVDAAFGLSLKDCVKLDRVVEMYQWVRKTKEENNTTVYYYVQEWNTTFHSDCGEGHFNNKNYWIVEQETQINMNVRLGAYLMSKSLAEQTNAKESIPMNLHNAQVVANFYGYEKGFTNYEANEQYIYFQQNKGAITMNDLRVSFNASKTGPTTVITYQQNDTFTPFVFQDKFNQTLARDQNFENLDNVEFNCANCCCFICKYFRSIEKPITEINWIYESILTLDQVFQKKADENQCTTTLQRLGGYTIMGVGFWFIFSPITFIVSVLPFIGNFLAQITVSFTISIPFSILIIAFAWLFYHPKYGFALMGLSALIGAGIYFYIKYQS